MSSLGAPSERPLAQSGQFSVRLLQRRPFGSVISGYIATLYEALSPTLFWTLNAGVCFLGSVAFYIFGPILTRSLDTLRADMTPPDLLVRDFKQPN